MHEAISEPLPVKQWDDLMGELPRDWWPIYRPLRDVVPLANNLYNEQRINLEKAKDKLAELAPTDAKAADPLTVWDESKNSFVPMWRHPSFETPLHEVQRYIGEAAQAAFDVKEFSLYNYLDVAEHELVAGNYARIMLAHVTCQSRIAFQFMPVEPDDGKDRWQAYIGVQDQKRTEDLQREATLIRNAVKNKRGLDTRSPIVSVVDPERMAGRIARRTVSASNIPNSEKLAARAHRITLFLRSMKEQYDQNVLSIEDYVSPDMIPTLEETEAFVIAHELGHEKRQPNKIGNLYPHLREAYATFQGLTDVVLTWPIDEDSYPLLARVKGGLGFTFHDLRDELSSGNWSVDNLVGDIYKPGSALFLLRGMDVDNKAFTLINGNIIGINLENMVDFCRNIALVEGDILDEGDAKKAIDHFLQIPQHNIPLIQRQLASA